MHRKREGNSAQSSQWVSRYLLQERASRNRKEERAMTWGRNWSGGRQITRWSTVGERKNLTNPGLGEFLSNVLLQNVAQLHKSIDKEETDLWQICQTEAAWCEWHSSKAAETGKRMMNDLIDLAWADVVVSMFVGGLFGGWSESVVLPRCLFLQALLWKPRTRVTDLFHLSLLSHSRVKR